MNILYKNICFVLLLSVSSPVWSWVQSGDTTIKEFVQWEDSGEGYALLILASGHKCFVPFQEKELYSLALALYMSGKTFNVHCHPEEKNIKGYMANKVHRINAVR